MEYKEKMHIYKLFMYLGSPDKGMARLNIQEKHIFWIKKQHLCTHYFGW